MPRDMGRSAFLTVVLSITVTAATYLGLHFVVKPRLPVHAVDVPSLTGLSAEQARGLLEPRGLLLILDEERQDGTVAPGTLMDQRPLAGSRLRRGEDVHAVVAKAPAPVKVPKLAGLTVDAARDALDQQKLKVGTVVEAPSATLAKGQVIGSMPAAGADAKADTTIDLQVSAGPAAQAVPSVLGKSRSGAKALLEKSGFAVGAVKYGSNDDYDSGVVIRQDPAANAQAAPGSKIDLTIND
jgi:beta-lactam-binding protein with PASTA domain